MEKISGMKSIISTLYDGKTRRVWQTFCSNCGKEVYLPKLKLRDKNYCSSICYGLARRTRVRVKLICYFCSREFERTVRKATYTEKKVYFCSPTCKNKYATIPKPLCLSCNIVLLNNDGKYCSHKCQADFQYNTYIERWLKGLETGNIGEEQISQYVRRYFFEKHNSKCSRCFWGKVNSVTGKVPLTLNHIDGNYRNSTSLNLELLCPNCHSLTPNFGSLNKGHGRKNRLLKLKTKV